MSLFTEMLRREAVRARDEHGNTDFYMTLREAAVEIERLEKEAELWRLRCEAERQAHAATMKECDEMLAEYDGR